MRASTSPSDEAAEEGTKVGGGDSVWLPAALEGLSYAAAGEAAAAAAGEEAAAAAAVTNAAVTEEEEDEGGRGRAASWLGLQWSRRGLSMLPIVVAICADVVTGTWHISSSAFMLLLLFSGGDVHMTSGASSSSSSSSVGGCSVGAAAVSLPWRLVTPLSLPLSVVVLRAQLACTLSACASLLLGLLLLAAAIAQLSPPISSTASRRMSMVVGNKNKSKRKWANEEGDKKGDEIAGGVTLEEGVRTRQSREKCAAEGEARRSGRGATGG
jgi:hypothetical protein